MNISASKPFTVKLLTVSFIIILTACASKPVTLNNAGPDSLDTAIRASSD
jgi:starvation-inducible outer membrane lipoprotein